MRLAIGILTNTPLWVYALFAYVVWQGYAALGRRTRPLWRLLLVPFVFLSMGVWRLVLATNLGWQPFSAWFVTALVLAGLGFARGPRLLAVDRERGLVRSATSGWSSAPGVSWAS